jgi:TolA-binding protein
LAIDTQTIAVVHTVRRHWDVTVERGRVVATEGERTREIVPSTDDEDIAIFDDSGPQPRAPRERADAPDLQAMLHAARQLRTTGDLDGAARAYGELIAAQPKSAIAAAASVSLGEIQLERGRASDALVAFDRYLRHGGALAEDASYGRIRALRALGRTADVERATAEFLARYPASAYAGKLRRP